MITIHYDFTDGTEVSFKQGLDLKDNFATCCLDFFCFDTEAEDVIVIRKDGSHIRRNALFNPSNLHTQKQITRTHNILKMFKAGSFEWNENNRPITKKSLNWIIIQDIFKRMTLYTNSFDYINYEEGYNLCTTISVHIDDHINDGSWYLKKY